MRSQSCSVCPGGDIDGGIGPGIFQICDELGIRKQPEAAVETGGKRRSPTPHFYVRASVDTKFFKKRPAFWAGLSYGAGDEARTRYLHLGKVALYRMSYTRIGNVTYYNAFSQNVKRYFYAVDIFLSEEIGYGGKRRSPAP